MALQVHKSSLHGRTWESGLSLGAGFGCRNHYCWSWFILRSSTHPQNAKEPKAANVIKPALTVTTVPVEQTQVELTLDTTGTVAARDLIPILPQANGLQVKKIPADILEVILSAKVKFWQF